jgi:hypothetical protein
MHDHLSHRHNYKDTSCCWIHIGHVLSTSFGPKYHMAGLEYSEIKSDLGSQK